MCSRAMRTTIRRTSCRCRATSASLTRSSGLRTSARPMRPRRPCSASASANDMRRALAVLLVLVRGGAHAHVKGLRGLLGRAFGGSPTEPLMTRSDQIRNDPTAWTGSLSGNYSACRTLTTTTPDQYETRVCHEYHTITDETCKRNLTVTVDQQASCQPGTWWTNQAWRIGPPDAVYANALCDPYRTDDAITFSFYAAGGLGACIGWQTVTLSAQPASVPSTVAWLAPHWSGNCQYGTQVVELAGSGCVGDTCSYNFQFGFPYTTCPAGETQGDQLYAWVDTGDGNGYWMVVGTSGQCYTTAAPLSSAATVTPVDPVTYACPAGATGPTVDASGNWVCTSCPAGASGPTTDPYTGAALCTACASGTSGPYTDPYTGSPFCAQLTADTPQIASTGWGFGVPLTFLRPHLVNTFTDTWDNGCATQQQRAGVGNCNLASSVCTGGPTDRTHTRQDTRGDVTRDCLSFTAAFT